jgi:predicted methyltransferase
VKIFGKEIRTADGKIRDSLWQRFRSWRLGRQIRKGKLPRGRTHQEVVDAITGSYKGIMGEFWGVLSAKVYRAKTGQWEDVGCISVQKITTAFRDRMVASLQNSTTSPMDVFKYHACGTGTTAEANTQTALVTEVGSRVSGTQTTDGNAYVYRTVATITPGGVYAITEHGVLSASTAGTLMDRSVFAAINVEATDSIAFTYDATFNAEA